MTLHVVRNKNSILPSPADVNIAEFIEHDKTPFDGLNIVSGKVKQNIFVTYPLNLKVIKSCI